jgi:hypothetical protein
MYSPALQASCLPDAKKKLIYARDHRFRMRQNGLYVAPASRWRFSLAVIHKKFRQGAGATSRLK